ncbi:MAG: ABC transporter substrate-binding protein [Proteobacteria bacterium]|nr:ABC transporter substrate-binding protein [Pseudomonadota bacterium]
MPVRRAAKLAALAVGVFIAIMPEAAPAKPVLIGIKTDTSSIDPHFSYIATNQSIAGMIFEPLINRDEQLRLTPGLALSWQAVDDKNWEFKLRPGVAFHDGSPFTADDVIFTVQRIPHVANSPASFNGHVSKIARMEAPDPLTLRIETKVPYPQLVLDLAEVHILPKRLGLDVSTSAFNAGDAAIGTGPYRFVRWVPNDRLELQLYDRYWGAKPALAEVTLKPIPNDAARQAALLADDVAMIDGVTPQQADHLKTQKDVALWSIRADRVMYLHIDTHSDRTPFVTAKGGAALDRNPLKDRRVRLALSKAVNRQAIVDRLLYGLGEPAGQVAVPGMLGYVPGIKPEPYDPDGARRLLAEAGYADGFAVTLQATNDRYLADAKVAETLGQMLSRIGLEMKIETMPSSIFFSRASKFEFSLFQLGWGSSQGNAAHGLRGVLMTVNRETGAGPSNRGRYSNPEVDRLTQKALESFDETAAERYMKEAATVAFSDVGVIPLYYMVNTWATRKAYRYQARMDERTFVQALAPQN